MKSALQTQKFAKHGRTGRCPVTKTVFRAYRKAAPHLTYMDAFRALGGR